MLLTLSTTAWTKTYTIDGHNARDIMEALSTSGFQVGNIDSEWSGKTITIKTEVVSCHYNAIISPDEWMTSVTCQKGHQDTPTRVLKDSLALAKSIRNYASLEAGVANRWITVNSIDCSLVYDQKNYSCHITSDDN